MFAKLKTFSHQLVKGVYDLFTKGHLNNDIITNLENTLLEADIGINITTQIIEEIKKLKFDKDISPEAVKTKLAQIISNILNKSYKKLEMNPGLNVILICGVNGNGKTTTIAKLANYFIAQNKKVALAACDTFRAAAVEQLLIWGQRLNCLVISSEQEKADPASVAYKALIETQDHDVLIIDTAGRLHNYQNLMDELAKINNVLTKKQEIKQLIVLDASVGQNAFNQIAEFQKAIPINGIIVTKLDGTAKAGAIIGISEKFMLPIYFIGIGEKKEDLIEFKPEEFAKSLLE